MPLFVPNLKDLPLASRLVDDARVDSTLLRRLVDEIERVLRLVRCEVISLVYVRYQKSPLFMIFLKIIFFFLELGYLLSFRISVLFILYSILLFFLVRDHLLDFPRIFTIVEIREYFDLLLH